MDTQHIEKMFGCIMERLDRQEQMLEDIRHNQRTEPPAENPAETKCLNGERLYDNQDLCSIGILPYMMLRQKTYYKESDVERFLSEHLDEFSKEQIEAYKARIR